MSKSSGFSRRHFLASTAAVVASSGYWTSNSVCDAALPRWLNERRKIGAIGLRYQGTVIAEKARAHGDLVALCDVDRHVREQARASFGSTAAIFEDYRDLLARKDIDVILIGTPDHWHSKMIIDACRAGKDVYCEKPLTLTIDEGKVIRDVIQQTSKVVQVGSWQRSDWRFRAAVELVRQGKIGALQSVEVVLGKNVQGGPFKQFPVPPNFNWDLWQGQTPNVPYLPERSHYTFRWWLEYSGGQMTDWGAHHIDIALWAIGQQPEEVRGVAKYPDTNGASYNVPIDFNAKYRFPSGVEMTVSDTGRNGILFTGTEGRLFVNRGTIAGAVVDAWKDKPPAPEFFKLYSADNFDRPLRAGKLDAIVNHMGNFFDCLETRGATISDVESQHRSATACHLGNIAMRLGRPLHWDSEAERIVGDDEANAFLSRPQREGFEVS